MSVATSYDVRYQQVVLTKVRFYKMDKHRRICYVPLRYDAKSMYRTHENSEASECKLYVRHRQQLVG